MFLKDFLNTHTLDFFRLKDHVKHKTEVFNFLLNYSSKLLIPADSNSVFPQIFDENINDSNLDLICGVTKFLTIINLCKKFKISVVDNFSKNKFWLSSYDNFLKYFSKNPKKLSSLFSLNKDFWNKEFDLLGSSDLERATFLYLLTGDLDAIFDTYSLLNQSTSAHIEYLSFSATEKIFSLIKESKNVEFLFDFGMEDEIIVNCDIVFDSNILIFTNKSLSDPNIQEDLVTLAACDLLSKEFNSSTIKNKYIYSCQTNQLFICK